MSTPTTRQVSSVSHRLRIARGALQDAAHNLLYASQHNTSRRMTETEFCGVFGVTPGKNELDDLERDALEALRRTESLRRKPAPTSQFPPEVLILIPDFWDVSSRDRDVISLTHVCRTWRVVFTSRPSLWSRFDCMDPDKTSVYLERSRTFPIDVQLHEGASPLSLGPFLQIVPQAVNRLRSLSVSARTTHLRTITDHLYHPAPLLASLEIAGGFQSKNHACISTIFNGDLPSSHVLILKRVRTRLPWRGMMNLTSLTLHTINSYYLSVGQFLDFLESTPSLRKIDLFDIDLAPTGGNGRVVSLGHLQRVDLILCTPISTLLDHLMIPVGAKLTTLSPEPGLDIDEFIPRSLDNLKNLSGFTKVYLRLQGGYDEAIDSECDPRMELNGPNGEFCMRIAISILDPVGPIFESLDRFDTSKVEELHTDYDIPHFEDTRQTLLPMRSIRTLVVSRCTNRSLSTFMEVLTPNKTQLVGVVCPLLERLVLMVSNDNFDIRSVLKMVAGRASRGIKLKSLVIVGDWVRDSEGGLLDVSELGKYVSKVEYSSKIPVDDDETKPSGGED